MRAWTSAPLVCLLAAGLIACAPPRVKTEPPGPALDAPVPPAHIVVPAEDPPAAPVAAASGAKPSPRVTRTPPRTPPAKTDKTAKPDKTEKPEAASSVPVKPAAEETPQAAAATLQTTANVDEEERKIRAVLARATSDLGQVDSRTLTADRKSQYDTAKRFAEQAEDALKDKNVVFARQLADKAATLAALLVKR